jgi:hypothetical protein
VLHLPKPTPSSSIVLPHHCGDATDGHPRFASRPAREPRADRRERPSNVKATRHFGFRRLCRRDCGASRSTGLHGARLLASMRALETLRWCQTTINLSSMESESPISGRAKGQCSCSCRGTSVTAGEHGATSLTCCPMSSPSWRGTRPALAAAQAYETLAYAGAKRASGASARGRVVVVPSDSVDPDGVTASAPAGKGALPLWWLSSIGGRLGAWQKRHREAHRSHP